jgi:hypothetical protein
MCQHWRLAYIIRCHICWPLRYGNRVSASPLKATNFPQPSIIIAGPRQDSKVERASFLHLFGKHYARSFRESLFEDLDETITIIGPKLSFWDIRDCGRPSKAWAILGKIGNLQCVIGECVQEFENYIGAEDDNQRWLAMNRTVISPFSDSRDWP